MTILMSWYVIGIYSSNGIYIIIYYHIAILWRIYIYIYSSIAILLYIDNISILL